MGNILSGLLLAAVYLLVFWGMGAVLPDRYQSGSVPAMCVCGFLLYFSLFQIAALPMKILRQPLSRLTVLWGCILLILGIYVLLRRRRVLADSLKKMREDIAGAPAILLLIFLALGIAILLGLNINNISDYDTSYYIGQPVSSAYSNTLGLMSPYTGQMQAEPDHFYLLNTDMLHCAVIYQALNVHPLIEREWSFTIAAALLFEMALYLSAKSLFGRDGGKILAFCFFSNLTLFCSYSLSGVSHYFAYRTYEGKSVISYLYTAVILCLCLALYKGRENRWAWAGLALCGVSGIAFSNSALFVLPAMTGLTLLPYVLTEFFAQRNRKALLQYLAVLLPCAAWLALYRIL